MDAETLAERTLEQTELDTADVLRVAEAILEEVNSDLFTCGAFVRVKAGLRTNTTKYPHTCKLLTRFLAEEFPGDSFLTLRLQKNVRTHPHKDSQNTFLPSLLCNLSPGAPGGTWVEDGQGTTWMTCPDGIGRSGRVLQGRKYRLSARQLWHACVPHAEDRVLLIGWVPAGWMSLANEDTRTLKSMGYIWPSQASEARGRLSVWGNTRGGGQGGIQLALKDFGIGSSVAVPMYPKTMIWPSGILNIPAGPLTICLSSDSEADSESENEILELSDA